MLYRGTDLGYLSGPEEGETLARLFSYTAIDVPLAFYGVRMIKAGSRVQSIGGAIVWATLL